MSHFGMFLAAKHMYLLSVMWQPGGEGNLEANEDMPMYG